MVRLLLEIRLAQKMLFCLLSLSKIVVSLYLRTPFKVTANLFGLEFCKLLKSYHKIAHYICFLVKKKLFENVFPCGVIANFVFFMSKMSISQGVMRCQHSLTPEQFDAGVHSGIFFIAC